MLYSQTSVLMNFGSCLVVLVAAAVFPLLAEGAKRCVVCQSSGWTDTGHGAVPNSQANQSYVKSQWDKCANSLSTLKNYELDCVDIPNQAAKPAEYFCLTTIYYGNHRQPLNTYRSCYVVGDKTPAHVKTDLDTKGWGCFDDLIIASNIPLTICVCKADSCNTWSSDNLNSSPPIVSGGNIESTAESLITDSTNPSSIGDGGISKDSSSSACTAIFSFWPLLAGLLMTGIYIGMNLQSSKLVVRYNYSHIPF
ncbi:hypothetical protein RvY_15119 [Ramazzottius varieornatus]|uniref:Protein quiver n=1 Tax=Ramazzottius varieornatus TaxID=947166 RepID=A0A1D1VYM3_RAMVA|nr:hypothetical protein RvY_15119 [Ramazzottius varieornatus]